MLRILSFCAFIFGTTASFAFGTQADKIEGKWVDTNNVDFSGQGKAIRITHLGEVESRSPSGPMNVNLTGSIQDYTGKTFAFRGE